MSFLSAIVGSGTTGLTQEQRAYQEQQLKRLQQSWSLTQPALNYALRTAGQAPAREQMAGGAAAGSAFSAGQKSLESLQHRGISSGGNLTERVGEGLLGTAGSAASGASLAPLQQRAQENARVGQIGQAGQGILGQADQLEGAAADIAGERARARAAERAGVLGGIAQLGTMAAVLA